MSGLPIIAFMFFFLSTLFGLGFFYGNEFCQAVFFLAAPLSLLAAINAYNCHRIGASELFNDSKKLYRLMSRYRLTVQVVGVIDVAVTSFWGIAINFSQTALVG